MRCRDTGNYQQLGVPVDNNLILFSIILGTIMEIGFVVAGIKVKRYCMSIWGVGLILASLSYFVMHWLGYL